MCPNIDILDTLARDQAELLSDGNDCDFNPNTEFEDDMYDKRVVVQDEWINDATSSSDSETGTGIRAQARTSKLSKKSDSVESGQSFTQTSSEHRNSSDNKFESAGSGSDETGFAKEYAAKLGMAAKKPSLPAALEVSSDTD